MCHNQPIDCSDHLGCNFQLSTAKSLKGSKLSDLGYRIVPRVCNPFLNHIAMLGYDLRAVEINSSVHWASMRSLYDAGSQIL